VAGPGSGYELADTSQTSVRARVPREFCARGIFPKPSRRCVDASVASRGWTAVRAPRVDLCASGGPIPHPNFEASGAGRPRRRSTPTCRRFLHTRRPSPPSNFEASGVGRPRRRSTSNFLIPSPAAFFFSSPSATPGTPNQFRREFRSTVYTSYTADFT
jgi:hypothetical protein